LVELTAFGSSVLFFFVTEIHHKVKNRRAYQLPVNFQLLQNSAKFRENMKISRQRENFAAAKNCMWALGINQLHIWYLDIPTFIRKSTKFLMQRY